MARTGQQEKTCEESGRVVSDDPVVAMLYTLMRDHLPAGVVASLVADAEKTSGPCEYTNGWLAQYAIHLAGRLKR